VNRSAVARLERQVTPLKDQLKSRLGSIHHHRTRLTMSGKAQIEALFEIVSAQHDEHPAVLVPFLDISIEPLRNGTCMVYKHLALLYCFTDK